MEYKINIPTVFKEIKEGIENITKRKRVKELKKNQLVLLEMKSITMEIKNQWKLIMKI